MEQARHKQTAAQEKDEKYFDKKIRFQIELQLGDEIHAARPPRRVQRPEIRPTSPLTECSDTLQESFMEGGYKRLSRTTGPNPVRSATESTVIIYKDELVVPVSLELEIQML